MIREQFDDVESKCVLKSTYNRHLWECTDTILVGECTIFNDIQNCNIWYKSILFLF